MLLRHNFASSSPNCKLHWACCCWRAQRWRCSHRRPVVAPSACWRCSHCHVLMVAWPTGDSGGSWILSMMPWRAGVLGAGQKACAAEALSLCQLAHFLLQVHKGDLADPMSLCMQRRVSLNLCSLQGDPCVAKHRTFKIR